MMIILNIVAINKMSIVKIVFSCLRYACYMNAESFSKVIGSEFGIVPGSRDNSLYNALWVAQALLRKGYVFTSFR